MLKSKLFMDDERLSKDPRGFYSIRNMPTHEELAKFYNQTYFQDEQFRAKNYQDSYDEKELEHINLINNLLNINMYYTCVQSLF